MACAFLSLDGGNIRDIGGTDLHGGLGGTFLLQGVELRACQIKITQH